MSSSTHPLGRTLQETAEAAANYGKELDAVIGLRQPGPDVTLSAVEQKLRLFGAKSRGHGSRLV